MGEYCGTLLMLTATVTQPINQVNSTIIIQLRFKAAIAFHILFGTAKLG
jgi:hypothetical protein